MDDVKESCQTLKVDKACLTVVSFINHTITVSTQSEECENCALEASKVISPYGNDSLVLDTQFGSLLAISIDSANESSCFLQKHFVEKGHYFLNVTQFDHACDVTNTNCVECGLGEGDVRSSLYTYIPIIIATFVLFALALAWSLFSMLYRKQLFQRMLFKLHPENHDEFGPSSTSVNDLSSSQQIPPPQKRDRLRSLDTFRGISIVVMIFVNYRGGGYWFFEHPPWNGLTVADLVFPWFMWIMGVSMAMSLRSILRKAVPRSTVIYKIVKRTVILFALGIILNSDDKVHNLETLRIPGVLQRFAVAYCVVAVLHLCFARASDTHSEQRWAWFRDVLLYWPEWIFMLSLMLVFLLLTFLLPVPGCPT